MAQPVETLIKVWKPLDQFSRPADTTTYALGDLMANDTAAANVIPLKFIMPPAPSTGSTTAQASIYVPSARFHMSKATVSAASFRLHLYAALPTFTSAGDNGVFGTVVATGNDGWLMDLDVSLTALHADGASGIAVPTEGIAEPQLITGLTPGSPWTIYGLIEVRDAYVPANGEIIKVRPLIEINF